MRKILLTIVVALVSQLAVASDCTFTNPDLYQGTRLLMAQDGCSYIFAAKEVKVDADGAPNAYHPDDMGLHCTTGVGFKGLDCPTNAGYPNSNWWHSALLPDPTNPSKAYVQSSGPYKGFFVSQTSLKDYVKQDIQTEKYVDARSVPYLVFPGNFYKKKGTGILGDFGYAINLENGKASPFIVAEVGPPNARQGEMSIALGVALGGSSPNPRTGEGTPKGKILYVIFPRSAKSPPWPVSADTLSSTVTFLLEGIGGSKAILSCADAL